MRYILFVKDECPFCQKAKNLLLERGLAHKCVSFEEDQNDILNEIKEAHGWKTVPMIFRKDEKELEFIGGCDDLISHLGGE